MSIPPLVCSTPPPPDQCEDEKDPEDFDLSYRLSQDEEDSYDFGSFSSYDNFQTNENRTSFYKKEYDRPIELEIHKESEFESNDKKHIVTNNNKLGINEIQENELKCEEEINIEDLNLEMNEELVTNIEDRQIQSHSLKETNDPSSGSNTHHNINTDSLGYDENTIDSLDSDKEIGTLDKINNLNEVNMDSEIVVSSEEKHVSEIDEISMPSKVEEFSKDVEEALHTLKNLQENVTEDDFGDFDDFHLADHENKITNVISDCDNPWESCDNSNSNFDNFKANFADNQLLQANTIPETNQIHSYESSDKQIPQMDNDVDDDFGDFDDFKSSVVTTEPANEHSSLRQDVPVLNLQSPENEQQILESISKVLTSIFHEEIVETDCQFEGKLETLLSETWAHLLDIDERQPYIINWNKSFGQKTLLKALSIDSRNILFGPKWSMNMPKYAANLSVAPLQPQKPQTPSTAIQSEINTDKSTSKHTTWTDPFTPDGQESCSTESDSPRITTGPPDLDVFESTISTKSDKIYSNTLSVQPLRHINLPDTHIFTPIDSEIPRSKTIHYDCTPTLILPKTVMLDSKKQPESISTLNNIVQNTKEDDNDYWEFQNFKASTESHTLPNNITKGLLHNSLSSVEKVSHSTSKQGQVVQTQPLQPVRVESSVPSLNWPEPGEVKGMIDDFSSFTSNSSQVTEKPDSVSSESISQIGTSNPSGNLNNINKNNNFMGNVLNSNKDDIDDDFNTFQSALPPKPVISELNANPGISSNKTSLSQIPDFEYAFPKTSNVKTDTISFQSVLRPNEALTQIVSHSVSNTITEENMSKCSMPSGIQPKTNMLQPTPANFSLINTQNQQKGVQILEPLSLESFSQINWPSPGIDLQDLSRFNPVENLQSLKSELSISGPSKGSSPVHNQKTNAVNQVAEDDVWGDFVSSNPKQMSQPKQPQVFADDDEWTDFISSPTVKQQNGVNTISLNVHTTSHIHKNVMQHKFTMKNNQTPTDIPTLNYITPKSSNPKSYSDRHFQNL